MAAAIEVASAKAAKPEENIWLAKTDNVSAKQLAKAAAGIRVWRNKRKRTIMQPAWHAKKRRNGGIEAGW
jgi:hypothetical protein